MPEVVAILQPGEFAALGPAVKAVKGESSTTSSASATAEGAPSSRAWASPTSLWKYVSQSRWAATRLPSLSMPISCVTDPADDMVETPATGPVRPPTAGGPRLGPYNLSYQSGRARATMGTPAARTASHSGRPILTACAGFLPPSGEFPGGGGPGTPERSVGPPAIDPRELTDSLVNLSCLPPVFGLSLFKASAVETGTQLVIDSSCVLISAHIPQGEPQWQP